MLLIVFEEFIAEDTAYGILVRATEQIFFGKSRMVAEVYILIPERAADLVKDVLRPQLEVRQLQLVGLKQDDCLRVGVRVLAMAGGVFVVEDRNVNPVGKSVHGVLDCPSMTLREQVQPGQGLEQGFVSLLAEGESQRIGHGFQRIRSLLVGVDSQDDDNRKKQHKRPDDQEGVVALSSFALR